MTNEQLSQIIVLLFALWVGRTWLNGMAVMLMASLLAGQFIMINLYGFEPDKWIGDFVFYHGLNLVIYFLFFFLFMHGRTKLNWSMAAVVAIQFALCIAFLFNGAELESFDMSVITLPYNESVNFVSELLNDILWKVECVIAWIAAYIARSDNGLGENKVAK